MQLPMVCEACLDRQVNISCRLSSELLFACHEQVAQREPVGAAPVMQIVVLQVNLILDKYFTNPVSVHLSQTLDILVQVSRCAALDHAGGNAISRCYKAGPSSEEYI